MQQVVLNGPWTCNALTAEDQQTEVKPGSSPWVCGGEVREIILFLASVLGMDVRPNSDQERERRYAGRPLEKMFPYDN